MNEAPIRCPHCGQFETFYVKPAWAWYVRSVGWPWARVVKAVKVQVGDCVVCLRCDQPYVVTASGSFSKRKPVPSPATRAPRNSDPVAELHAAVNALPDEP